MHSIGLKKKKKKEKFKFSEGCRKALAGSFILTSRNFIITVQLAILLWILVESTDTVGHGEDKTLGYSPIGRLLYPLYRSFQLTRGRMTTNLFTTHRSSKSRLSEFDFKKLFMAITILEIGLSAGRPGRDSERSIR